MPEKNRNRPGRPRKPVTGTAGDGLEREDTAVVSSLSKALRILALFNADHPDWSPSEMATATGLHRGSVYRILRTMEQGFFLGVDPATGRYHLGPAMYPVAYLTQSHSELKRVAHSHVERLAADTGESANLAVDIDGWPVVIDEVLTSNVYKPVLPSGEALGDVRSSHAKLYLAFKSDEERRGRIALDERLSAAGPAAMEGIMREMDSIRAEGVAYDIESLPGVCALSVPVFDHAGRLRASLSVVAPPTRFGHEEMREYLELARAEAAALSRELGYDARRLGYEG